MYAISQKPPAGGCCSDCGPSDAEASAGSSLLNTCTLAASDFDKRVASIRDLARRAMIESQRDPRRLRLTYKLTAFVKVEELVAREAQCCPFLTFELRLEGGKVDLTITA